MLGRPGKLHNVPGPMASPRVLCMYHYPCHDGVFAALAVHLAHASPVEWWPNTVWAPHAVESLSLKGDETVYLCDFSGGPGFPRALSQHAKQVVLLDHHKTAAAELADPALKAVSNLEVDFDLNRSGATIAYDYFHLGAGLTAQQQSLFRYIEDADLWRWQLPHSKAFTAGLMSLCLEYDARKNPAIWDQLLALTPQKLIDLGTPILAEQQRMMQEAVAQAFPVDLGGAAGAERRWGRCLAVQIGPEMSKLIALRSELGNALAIESQRRGLRGMAVVAYGEAAMGDPSKLKCSLRSIDGDQDTTVISELYGGGGHLNASSFICDVAEFEGWRCT
ncbi:hypothetical protein ACK3TF_001036 [Chlorella vulgaris]